MYQVVKFFGLVGQIQALWIVYPTFSIPFATWLLMGYVQSLPEDLEQAAMIDGASRLQTLIRIVLPLMARHCSPSSCSPSPASGTSTSTPL